MEAWISEEQRVRISELIAEGATSWRLQQETGLSRFQVLRAVRRLAKRPVVIRGSTGIAAVSGAEVFTLGAGACGRAVGAGCCAASVVARRHMAPPRNDFAVEPFAKSSNLCSAFASTSDVP